MPDLLDQDVIKMVKENRFETKMDCLIVILREIGIRMRSILIPFSDRCTNDILEEMLDSSWAILAEPEDE